MGLDNHLTLDISYDIRNESFNIDSDANEEAYSSLIETYLHTQIGAGRDNSPANEKDIYHIRLEWYPQNDNFVIKSDTGNKRLREGILMKILRKLTT
jgi:hypothetical protein